MIGILLCAGYATRLYPLTEKLPKPLLPVADRPMLEHILEKLESEENLEKIIIISNDKFYEHFCEWNNRFEGKWPIEVVNDHTTSNETRLGAIGDLVYVRDQKKLIGKDLLVIAGDNLFDSNLAEFVRFGQKHTPHAAIAVYDVKDKNLAKRYGLVEVSSQEKGRVSEFLEKPENPSTTLASCGVYWLPSQTGVLLDRYLKDGHNADQPGHYIRWLSQKDRVYAIPLDGRWYDIGDLESYKQANAIFQNQ